MTATARITAQTTAANYDFTVTDGASKTFTAGNLLAGENIRLLWKDSTGNFHIFKGEDSAGKRDTKEINMYFTTRKVSGPFDGRWVKPITENEVELTELT